MGPSTLFPQKANQAGGMVWCVLWHTKREDLCFIDCKPDFLIVDLGSLSEIVPLTFLSTEKAGKVDRFCYVEKK